MPSQVVIANPSDSQVYLYRLVADRVFPVVYVQYCIYTCISQVTVRLASRPAGRWRRRPWWNSHALSLIAGRAGRVAEAGGTSCQATWPVCLPVLSTYVSRLLYGASCLCWVLWCGVVTHPPLVMWRESGSARQRQRWYAINASWEWCGGTWMLGVLSQCDLIYVHISLTHSVACGAGAWLVLCRTQCVLCRSSRPRLDLLVDALLQPPFTADWLWYCTYNVHVYVSCCCCYWCHS